MASSPRSFQERRICNTCGGRGWLFYNARKMRRWRSTRYRVLAMACACVVLLTRSAAASDRSVVADFDGDGRHDRATLHGRGPSSEIHIWLSTIGSVAVIRTPTRIGAIAASDLDGDHRDELIGRTSTRLQVWTVRQRRFEHVLPRTAAANSLGRTTSHHVDDRSEAAPFAVSVPDGSDIAVVLSPRPRAPAVPSAHLSDRLTAGFPPSLVLAVVAPRPPPVSP
jgi:hypothetical protein